MCMSSRHYQTQKWWFQIFILYIIGANMPLYVMYTNNRSVGEALAERLRTQGLEIPDDRIIAVGAAIGSHIGPEACGLVYVSE